MTTRHAPGNPYVDDPDEIVSTSEWADVSEPEPAEKCLSCGCGKPHDDHDDDRHITLEDVQAAGAAAGIAPGEAASNVASGYRDAVAEKAAPVSAVGNAALIRLMRTHSSKVIRKAARAELEHRLGLRER